MPTRPQNNFDHYHAHVYFGDDSAQFESVIAWLDDNRAGLTIFVHGLSGNDYDDHTINATWLGEEVELKLSVFDD